MKSTIKVYLTPETLSRLKSKALEAGFDGRGWLGHYLEFLSTRDIAVIDENIKKLLRAMQLK